MTVTSQIINTDS